METFGNIKQELEQLSPIIANIPKYNLFAVPNGYFDNMPETILELIKNDPKAELESLSPIISTLSKENIFTVPDGYFTKELFIPKIVKNETKIISINSKRNLKQTWLAAASVVLLIGISIPWWKSNVNQNNILNEQAFVEKINKINDATLNTYINSNTLIIDPTILNTPKNLTIDTDISESINSINEKEIDQYFVENQYLALK